jgi:hypothetical protein
VIVNNGTRKGGQPDVMKILHSSPGLEDLWQIHFSQLSGQEYTVPGMFIANLLDEPSAAMPVAPIAAPAPGPNTPPPPAHNGPAYWIKLSAQPDGSFTVTNARNGFTKAYAAIKPGTRLDSMALNVDFAPTLLNLAGQGFPIGMHGRSLTELFTGRPVPWRDAWYYEYFEFPDVSHNVVKHRGVRTDRYKFIHYYEPPFAKWGEEFELYDLEKDPQERVNLYRPNNMPAAVKETVDKLKQRMTELRKELGAG